MALSSIHKRLLHLVTPSADSKSRVPSAPAKNTSSPLTLAEQIESMVAERRRPAYLTATQERDIFVRELALSRSFNEIQINCIVTALGDRYPTVESLLVAVEGRNGETYTFYPDTDPTKPFYPYAYPPRRPGPRVYDGPRPMTEEKKLLGTLYSGGVTDEWLAKDFIAPLRLAASQGISRERTWWQARGYHCKYHYMNQIWGKEIEFCYCGGRNVDGWRRRWSGEEFMKRENKDRRYIGKLQERDIYYIQFLDGSRWNAPFSGGPSKA